MLFDRDLLKRNRLRGVNNHFLVEEIRSRIGENLELLNRKFENILEINEENFSYPKDSFDLVISNLDFHYINDIPQYLIEIKNILKPGGIFIASFFGEENLSELAHVLHLTENEIYGGISPKMPPTIDVKTAANLLQKAGFQNPISDFERIEVEYSDPLNLLKDLKAMGQGNVMLQRSRRFFTRGFLNKISKNYRRLYQNNNGKILATFEIVTICGSK
jgi:NADH dehydrogenase [ubiquinone] 1 alpha subcomplex assembly factor 5